MGLHETFANEILAHEFPPPDHRNAEDQRLIQELLNIDKLSEENIKAQILKYDPKKSIANIDIAIYRDQLREDKLRELIGIRKDAPLEKNHRRLLEQLADSKDLADRLNAYRELAEKNLL